MVCILITFTEVSESCSSICFLRLSSLGVELKSV